MTKKYRTINRNKIENRIDFSAWFRLNDIIWEPARVPVHKDKDEFNNLEPVIQDTFLKSFSSLAFLSSLQVKIGDDIVKKDSATQLEYSVFNALAYLEAIANRGYNYVIQTLADPTQVDSMIEWAENSDILQDIATLIGDVYLKGSVLQKKIALSFVEMAVYHADYYTPLYIFGEGKLVRSAEIIKLAIRSTSFNAMYPGVKFRASFDNLSKEKQDDLKVWIDTFIANLASLVEKHIDELYTNCGWNNEVKHYFRYTINKNYMNLGFPTPYPDDANTINPTIQRGVIKSADFEDFFYYQNSNRLTDFHEEQ